MILWINGAFGAGKTTIAFELNRRMINSFVYDPENAGDFIRQNTPAAFSKVDFQDIPMWREINYSMLKMLVEKCTGTIIVPMTLVNPEYFNEIITRLREDDIEVKHFILYATRESLEKNLKKRSQGNLEKEKFALDSIDRCIFSYDNYIKDTKIFVDGKTVIEVADEILEKNSASLD